MVSLKDKKLSHRCEEKLPLQVRSASSSLSPLLSLLDRGLFTGLWLVFSEAFAFLDRFDLLLQLWTGGSISVYLSSPICEMVFAWAREIKMHKTHM